jgi:hypothetical protein
MTQKDKITEFVKVTNSSKYYAQKLLKQFDWSMEKALDHHYQTNSNIPTVESNHLLNSFFNEYSQSDFILVQGTEKLCLDLNIEPTDSAILVFAFYCKAKSILY